ncbi:hydroxypyruvate reductase [Amycolatopsis bartoniae]|uniref:DUF4147 domain-containing protein n=1 Tax=Amycolatopsis bartoniae TaxID=941986 RepID=A0A8H9MEV6_9PSEU|nr:DUF4147 domain-containing protein [Amycolatopsis bartoniae]MBB2935536.1 hydroxypyruvate reductase [Amycolatopsis bartoniae]TVT03873.1 DUF4147 domain-containing protein [Amycolatopsis bartoniae]GHF76620.1 hypothetical protein GCM10017566_58410 [Amycolatopsis bartoniae]
MDALTSPLAPVRGTSADAVCTVALRIAEAGCDAVAADRVMERAARELRLERQAAGGRLVVLVLGKAARGALDGLGRALDGKIHSSFALGGTRYPAPDQADVCALGDHPLPAGNSTRAVRSLREFVSAQALTSRDTVVVAVTGGATAMLSETAAPLLPGDLAELSRLLLRSGLDVTTVNAVRRACAPLLAGGLLDLLSPARCIGLVLTDNVQVGFRGVGSGPTFATELDLLFVRHVVTTQVPEGGLRARLLAAVDGGASRRGFGVRHHNHEVGGPGLALSAMIDEARALGLAVESLGAAVQGDVELVARTFAGRLDTLGSRATAVLGCGEVTVAVRGQGRGGRCQELALRVAQLSPRGRGFAFVAAATDGVDNLPGVSGAWVTHETKSRAAARGLDIPALLRDNDSHRAHRLLGQVLTGPAGISNTCDVYVGITTNPHG